MNGHIWTTTTDMVAGGAAVARTLIENLRVPDAAKMLLGWKPKESTTAQAVAESLLSVFSIEGSNFKYQPQEVICGNVGDSFLATGSVLLAPSEYYDVFAPVNGGEIFDIYVEPCDAIAGNRRSGAEFTWTDVRLGLPVIKSQCSREVAIAAAAVGIVHATTLTISEAHRLCEVMFAYTHAVATVQEELNLTAILKCTVWNPVQELSIMGEPAGGAGVTPAAGLARLTRSIQNVDFRKEAATVLCDFDIDVTLTDVGQFVHGIRWV